MVTDAAAQARYVAAFRQSDFERVLNHYKANYPKPDAPPPATPATFPKVKAPVHIFRALEDQALLPGALNGTWEWVEQDLTIVTIADASHFVQHDAPQMVSNTMVDRPRRRKK